MPPRRLHAPSVRRRHSSVTEPLWVRWLLSGLALLFLSAVLFVPLIAVFVNAFRDGIGAYFGTIVKPETLAAIKLTLVAAAIAVPVNIVFGLAVAWLLSKYVFAGKSLLTTLLDVPFSVSPVIAGLVFVLLFGRRGWLGPWLDAHDLKIIFAVPGIVLATTFITLPFVAREVLPLMQSQGSDEEEASLTLGAGGFRTFLRVTLPKVRWAVLYGVVLCNARAMGEFGAVSVVSGHIRGLTNTMPLYVELLYNDYDFAGSFTVASLLALLALVTLGAKRYVEWRSGHA
jgi:sulfate transport system permease protein